MGTLAHKYMLLLANGLLAALSDKLHVSTPSVLSIHALTGLVLGYLWHKDIVQAKLKDILQKLNSLPKPVGAILLVLALGFGGAVGCSMTPQQIETDTTIGAGLAIQAAVTLDPAARPEIEKDIRIYCGVLKASVIPAFTPGTNAGAVASSAVTQAQTLLANKLSASPTGHKVSEIVALFVGPLSSSLGSTSSPGALLGVTKEMQALGVWCGLCQAGANFLNDQTLAPPPLPPVPVVPPPAPPAPTPAAPAKQ